MPVGVVVDGGRTEIRRVANRTVRVVDRTFGGRHEPRDAGRRSAAHHPSVDVFVPARRDDPTRLENVPKTERRALCRRLTRIDRVDRRHDRIVRSRIDPGTHSRRPSLTLRFPQNRRRKVSLASPRKAAPAPTQSNRKRRAQVPPQRIGKCARSTPCRGTSSPDARGDR